ncbi:MAG: PEP-CTERM sorting domain-containing protein [Stellaceae bacterium]
MTAGVALVSAPAFAWYGGGGCMSGCGGTPVPEPSTLALLGVAIPGAAAWIKHKLF